MTRPPLDQLLKKSHAEFPASLRRIMETKKCGVRVWIGPNEAASLSADEQREYDCAHNILMRLAIEAPAQHASGHPGGTLSAFTFAYEINRRRDPARDQTLRFSAGHLSLLAFALEWLFGRDRSDERLASPRAIQDAFRTIGGLPGHAEAGVGDIPFGTGPLGKGVSNALGVAFGQQYLTKNGMVDVLLADGDSQEGQVLEAFRLASALSLDRLVVHGDWNDIQLSGVPSRVMATDMADIAFAMGWSVIEVQNGNDYGQVRAALNTADSLAGKGHPVFICYYTTMGYGVPLMEEGSNTGRKNFHGSPLTAEEVSAALASLSLPSLEELSRAFAPARQRYKKAFVAALSARRSSSVTFSVPREYKRAILTKESAARKDFGAVHIKSLMAHDARIVVLHADLADSGGFGAVQKAFPDRVINVGVAEANMYMMAAGMRQAGLLPVTYTFAAFGVNEARANARLIDVNTGHIPLGVLHDCTHAGLSVGEDGETHQERNYVNLPFDNTQVWVSGDSNQAGAMAEKAFSIIAEGKESVFVFSGRSNHPQLLTATGEALYDAAYEFDGRATIVRGYGDMRDAATIISYGAALHEAVKAADALSHAKRSIRVLNSACIRPLDSAAIMQAALETKHLVVVEDHNTEGGLATQIADLIADLSLPCTLRRLGVRHYHPSAPADQLIVLAGIDEMSIASALEDQLSLRLSQGEEALVAFLYGLRDRLPSTRFVTRALPFIERLCTDAAYVRDLREDWKSRRIAESDFPTDDTCREMLKPLLSLAHLSALTGTEPQRKHDPGIVA